jgi:predicted kinase
MSDPPPPRSAPAPPPEAVIFTGLQATGKSTFYRERFFQTHVRINLDMLRTRHRERILLQACLEAMQPFVVDNTNPTAAARARYIAPARAAGFRVVGYYFQSNVRDVLARNATRPVLQQVPAKGIFGTRKALQPPSLAEGFDALYYVEIKPGEGFQVHDWSDAV